MGEILQSGDPSRVVYKDGRHFFGGKFLVIFREKTGQFLARKTGRATAQNN